MAPEDINPGQPALFQADAIWPYFERLRKEDPVHYTAVSEFGPYWSITRYQDIVAVDTNHQVFSSDSLYVGGIIGGEPGSRRRIDVHRHGSAEARCPAQDGEPGGSPANLRNLAPIIRERAGGILDSLPVGEAVDRVSVQLTTMTLATLFDFPFEERR